MPFYIQNLLFIFIIKFKEMRSFGSAVFSLLLLLLFLFISQSSALSRFRRRSGKSNNPAPYKQQTYNQQPHYQQQEEATNAGGYNRNYGETQNWQQQKPDYGEQLPATWQWQRSYGSQPAEHKTDRQRSDQLLTTVTSASIMRGATQRVINYTRLTSVFGFVFNQYKRLVYAKLVVFYGAEAAAEIANAFVNAWKSISFGEFNSWLEARRENGLQEKMLDLGREFASKLKEPLQLMAKGLFNAKVWEEKTRNLFTMNAIIHFALDFLLPFGLSFFVTDDISKPIALRFITFWHNDLKGKEKELQDQMDEYINRSVPGPLTKSMTTLTYNGILSTIYQGIKGVQLYNNFINGDVKAIVKQFEPALLSIKQQAVQVHNLEAMVKHVIKWLLVKKAPLLDILFYEIIDEHIERISEPIAVGLGVVLFEVEKAAVANLENSDAGKGQTKKHTD